MSTGSIIFGILLVAGCNLLSWSLAHLFRWLGDRRDRNLMRRTHTPEALSNLRAVVTEAERCINGPRCAWCSK